MKERDICLHVDDLMVQCRILYTEDECGIIVEEVYGIFNGTYHNLNIKLLYKAQDILNEEWEALRPPIT
jgi:hypothetical protein